MTLSDTAFREWRTRLGLTQRQAALELGYGKRRIEAYDRGEEKPPRVVLLAMAMVEQTLEKSAA